MNLMQEFFLRAATELQLRVEINFVILLPDGRQVVAQARFPDLGAPKGIVVFRSEAEVAFARREIVALGYGDSIMGEPLPDAEFDLESYAEMFADWGWIGPPEKKPSWMA
jgi:hypothetical protein